MSLAQAIYHWWQVHTIKKYLSRMYKAFGADTDVVESKYCRFNHKCRCQDKDVV